MKLPTLLTALLLSLPAAAGDHHDHDRARRAVEAGEVLPLRQVLDRVAAAGHRGEVLEVELERERGAWVYEIRMLAPGGRILDLEVDAATGVLRRREGR